MNRAWARAVQGKASVEIQALYPHGVGSRENPGIKRRPVKDARARAMVNDAEWTQVKVTVPASGAQTMYLEFKGQNVYVDAFLNPGIGSVVPDGLDVVQHVLLLIFRQPACLSGNFIQHGLVSRSLVIPASGKVLFQYQILTLCFKGIF